MALLWAQRTVAAAVCWLSVVGTDALAQTMHQYFENNVVAYILNGEMACGYVVNRDLIEGHIKKHGVPGTFASDQARVASVGRGLYDAKQCKNLMESARERKLLIEDI